MAQVPVFVPWHVAARDTVRETARRWMPASRPARIAAIGLAASVASVLTVAILWVATQTELVTFATSIASSRLREIVMNNGREVLLALFGTQTVALVTQAGAIGLLLLLGGFIVIAAGTAMGLRTLAVASSRRRS